MLVGATSAFLVILALRAIDSLSNYSFTRADPTQIIQAIVIGVSFLGAGTIFRRPGSNGEPVQGLTTGASVLSVAAIGVAIAFDAYVLALGVTIWDLFVNWALSYLERRVKRKLGK
jgi:putative Mg2+ transporter-C (MgtC) family protein